MKRKLSKLTTSALALTMIFATALPTSARTLSARQTSCNQQSRTKTSCSAPVLSWSGSQKPTCTLKQSCAQNQNCAQTQSGTKTWTGTQNWSDIQNWLCTQGWNCTGTGSDCTSAGCGSTTTSKPETNVPSTPSTPNQPATPDQPETNVPDQGSSSVSELERAVVTLVNKERAAYGLSPLTISSQLCDGARLKSQDMRNNNYFDHNSPTYGTPFEMMRSLGITYSAAAENIAMGYSTAEAVVNGWMNSAGHRANILSEQYTTIGVGYVQDGGYWTQWFTR